MQELIVVHNNGQLYALGEVADLADALLNIWTPGQEGGQAVGEILLGKVESLRKVGSDHALRGCRHPGQRYPRTPENPI